MKIAHFAIPPWHMCGRISGGSPCAPNAYGGYDIAGPYQANESLYGTARGWTVYKAHDVDRNAYCVAVNSSAGGSVRIGYDGLQWQLAVPVQVSPDWTGEFLVDGKSTQGPSRNASVSGTAVNGWAIVWMGMAEYDGLRNGRNALLSVDRYDIEFSLAGSTAATLMVEECVQNGGIAPVAVRPSQQLPAQVAAGTTMHCTDAYDQTFSCVATQLTPEPGYSEKLQIIAATGDIGWTVNIRAADRVAEVWVMLPQAWQGWRFFGYWVSTSADGTCMAPVPTSSSRRRPTITWAAIPGACASDDRRGAAASATACDPAG